MLAYDVSQFYFSISVDKAVVTQKRSNMFSHILILLLCLEYGMTEPDTSSCSIEKTITLSALNEKELREKLEQQLESVLLENPNADISISMEFNHAVPTEPQQGIGNCDVKYNDKCFRVIVYPTKNISFSNAEAICSEVGWKLANVYDEAHYQKLISYMRPKIYSDYFSVWTGLKYMDSHLLLTNGEAITLPRGTVWYPGHPKSNTDYTNIGIDVNRNKKSDHPGQGLFNIVATRNYHGALCEKQQLTTNP
uniref:uncharacterized protein LOC120327624 isoform X2 n=1 Tax=Styela clava TaxID=7725 RepID=UPI0019392C29|nr:uncharacterized protein LOC120327624 isoform X2 [Styela clava]